MRILLSCFLIFYFIPSLAFSCKREWYYKHPTTEEAFASAGIVFEGVLISNKPLPDDNGCFLETVGTFQIHEVWKGKLTESEHVEITLSANICDNLGRYAKPGEHYVVFARRGNIKRSFGNGYKSFWASGYDCGTLQVSPVLVDGEQNRNIQKTLDKLKASYVTQPSGAADALSGRR